MLWTPYHHQRETMTLYAKGTNCLNGSEPGTGKTPPTIEHIKRIGGRATVVCPSYLTRNWQREFKRFADLDASIYPDTSKPITLISADSIHKCAAVFQQLNVLVVDEAHMFGSIKTRRTKALHHYVKEYKPKQVILMTGTPLKSRVPQLYSLLLLLDYGKGSFHNRYPSLFQFCMHFCEMKKIRMGSKEFTQFEGLKNAGQLRDHLKPWWVRYRLEQLVDMPRVTYSEVEADTHLGDLDLLMSGDLETELSAAVGAPEGWAAIDLSQIVSDHVMRAKAASARAKVPVTVSFAQDLLEQDAGPLVIFSAHVAPVAEIAEALAKGRTVAKITGAVSPKERDRIVQDFQAGKIDVLVGTISACCTGITLTKSNIVIFNDKSYDVSENVQAVGRIRRVSQTKPCLVYEVVSKGIDQRISRLLREKEKLMKEVFAD